MTSGLKKAGYLTVAFVSAGAFALIGASRLYFSRHPHGAAPAAASAPVTQPEKTAAPVTISIPSPAKGKDFADIKGFSATTRDGKTVTFDFIAIADPKNSAPRVFGEGEFEKMAAEAAQAVIARHSLKGLDDSKTLRNAVDAVKRTGGKAQDVTLTLASPAAVRAEVTKELASRAGPVKCDFTGIKASLAADELRSMAGVSVRSRKP